MAFVSYAQNFEDVMLWRALKHIEKGFYIDVGAWSPDRHSVTRAFYEKNWSGINIEPHPEYQAQLTLKRPRDINLCLALSNKSGCLPMNFINQTGLSTLDENIAKKHSVAGYPIEKREVSVTTLAEVWQKYVSANQEVHFLKIDVEGLEKKVIQGNHWEHYQPWIVVVESTIPLTQEEVYEEWEKILLSAGYRFVYSDAINRFYISQRQAELQLAFKYPPNIFDGFLIYEQIDEFLLQQDLHYEQLIQAENHIKLLLASTSWRITAPLRNLKIAFRSLSQKLKNYFLSAR